ncbi:tRNA preQ1(34) S-adenosylmethionine ribosyltransferase-isomerase QueA [Ihubacter massiliensis]|uniref:S-adenosylmethionine:tRNA ribosyltransferase-isomerase n=1 Tax=Hominibacterium faecale TaxID=2839743 RepID=A0A9J6QRM3_9FIRM|nr:MULTISPECIES: tRNA preQ1(34) S-adenosylmethionine ribosyltransferase-isomerase QueA [Eubacteriales Family XIII. Incertae Sedis]MCO7121144.1 tRNA preQ1(34) S-adenosylmethionine ribosyltransferase-isomerase QueA [Ihubacter massiliensis]MCU7378060.1 tRNA preQ1(34) S-adenosylmethionine ribosyltransferase-isomerase QueA [Hominibacterium faecale]
MHINEFDYHLPQELIAQKPADKRDCSRLMVLNRENDTIEHRHFYDILEYLLPGDCLVLNNSKVLPARLFGTKEETGAKVEFLLTKRIEGDRWETMVRPGKRLKPGDTVAFSPDFKAENLDYGKDGTRIVEFHYQGIFMERLEELGKMPLPPYIERDSDQEDKERYQTVYCKEEGSVAAPTAGLHFTEELLRKAEEKGVKIAYVTLHVGIGTFRPVKCETIEEHEMHFEEYEVSQESARLVNETKAAGGRILSVGTTSTRTLESAAVFENGQYRLKAGAGSTGIFIYPGYEFKLVDGLITNFHLPKSTLLMLISALYDREKILSAYEVAVKERYRFFSYGDAMLIV